MPARLTLDEPRNIYYSGQVLKGCVEFECEQTQPLTYSVININFTGEAKVFWTETEIEEYNGVQRNVSVGYKSHETYFNTTICASGGMGPITLPPGSHKVPFEFQIPHTAPSTFAGDRGSVSYKVTAYIEYPDLTKNRDQLEQQFEVVAPLDLNLLEDVKRPVNLEFEELYTCCCEASSPMTIRVHIPGTGFCPGQVIPISISAENKSRIEIKKIIIRLISKQCYHSTQPKSDYIPPEEVIETIKTGSILANTKREITHELIIPAFIAANLQNCNIIDVGYFLNVIIKLSDCNDDLEDETEICMGLVPISSLVTNYKHPMQSDLPQAAIPDPNFILAPPKNMPYQTNAMQNSAACITASPYPNSGRSFPNVTPYPSNASPYPSDKSPYASNAAPYPTNLSPFPTHATAYPPDKPNHPQPGIPLSTIRTGNIGFVSPPVSNHGQNTPYHETNPSYHGKNPPYPGPNPPYTGANPPYPGANPPYPGANPPYPGANPPYPGANPPYPGTNPPYPGANPPYPGTNPPYPGANPPYPGANPPYPGANPPYPGANEPCPESNPPYPSGGAPYPSDQPEKGSQPPYPVYNAPSAPPS